MRLNIDVILNRLRARGCRVQRKRLEMLAQTGVLTGFEILAGQLVATEEAIAGIARQYLVHQDNLVGPDDGYGKPL